LNETPVRLQAEPRNVRRSRHHPAQSRSTRRWDKATVRLSATRRRVRPWRLLDIAAAKQPAKRRRGSRHRKPMKREGDQPVNLDIAEIDGACHCGTVRFRARLTNGFHTARRCTCSYCRMRGAVAVSAPVDGIEILAGEHALTAYRFNTGIAKHFFCSGCGIYTHHQRRSNPREYGVNVACLDGVSPFDFAEVTVLDGVNHPSDTKTKVRIAGVLRFTPSAQSTQPS
jgi:hypothetical protein